MIRCERCKGELPNGHRVDCPEYRTPEQLAMTATMPPETKVPRTGPWGSR